jgi:hypothetical protein
MKRLWLLILAAVMMLSCVACSTGKSETSKQTSETTSTTEADPLASMTTNELVKQIIDGMHHEMITVANADIAVVTTDPFDEEIQPGVKQCEFYLGLTGDAFNANISAASIAGPNAEMSYVSFSIALVRIKDGADIKALAATMMEKVWTEGRFGCLAPNKIITLTHGNYIALMMLYNDDEEKACNSFDAIFGSEGTEKQAKDFSANGGGMLG